jgi:polysaccharide pyruvyl transferase WcaK-like protein
VTAPGPTWPPGGPRVLVTDGWLTNAGDAAIALATDALVRRLAPGAAVVHAAYGADLVGGRYPGLCTVSPLEDLTGTRWAPHVPGSEAAGVDLVAGADLVVSQGGGFLHEAYRPWARIDALARAAAAGVPVVVLGQTIGDVSLTFARRALGALLRDARLVVVRDPASRHHVVSLGVDPGRVVLGTDVALALVPEAPQRAPGAGSAPGGPPGGPISVVLAADPLPGRGRAREPLAAVLLRAVADRCPSADLRVWSSAQGIPGRSDDHRAAATAVAALPAAARVRVTTVGGHVDAHHMLELARDSSAVVSMRLHPALLAARQGVPAVLLLEDAKADVLAGFGPGAAVVRGSRPVDAEAAAARLAGVLGSEVGPGPVERLAAMEAALAEVLAEVGRPVGGRSETPPS